MKQRLIDRYKVGTVVEIPRATGKVIEIIATVGSRVPLLRVDFGEGAVKDIAVARLDELEKQAKRAKEIRVSFTPKEAEVVLELMGNGYANGDFYDDTGYGGEEEDKAAQRAYTKLAKKLKYVNTELK